MFNISREWHLRVLFTAYWLSKSTELKWSQNLNQSQPETSDQSLQARTNSSCTIPELHWYAGFHHVKNRLALHTPWMVKGWRNYFCFGFQRSFYFAAFKERLKAVVKMKFGKHFLYLAAAECLKVKMNGLANTPFPFLNMPYIFPLQIDMARY